MSATLQPTGVTGEYKTPSGQKILLHEWSWAIAPIPVDPYNSALDPDRNSWFGSMRPFALPAGCEFLVQDVLVRPDERWPRYDAPSGHRAIARERLGDLKVITGITTHWAVPVLPAMDGYDLCHAMLEGEETVESRIIRLAQFHAMQGQRWNTIPIPVDDRQDFRCEWTSPVLKARPPQAWLCGLFKRPVGR